MGFVVTLGLCTGLIVHTSAVALGVAAVFQASAMAFNLLKYAGAAYLLYLAWGAFRAGASVLSSESDQEISLARYYLRGIVMNVTNPKVSIFFLAFLPQFTRRNKGICRCRCSCSARFSFSRPCWCSAQSACWQGCLVNGSADPRGRNNCSTKLRPCHCCAGPQTGRRQPLIDTFMLTMAMTALGTETSLDKFRQAGAGLSCWPACSTSGWWRAVNGKTIEKCCFRYNGTKNQLYKLLKWLGYRFTIQTIN